MDATLLLRDFVTLWVVVDPIGTVPVFLAATAGQNSAQKRGIALRAIVVSAAVLLFFLICGQFLLEAMGISLVSFQIAGGIILLLFALSMVFGKPKPISDLDSVATDKLQSAVFPVAIPSIASPGAMLAIVLLTDNHRFSIADQALTAGLLALVLACALALMLLAAPIHKIIGNAGENIISRVMGMILAAVAVNAVLNAFVTLGWVDRILLSANI